MALFTGIVVAVILAAVCGVIAHIFKQPTMLGFIAAGLAVGVFGSAAQFNVDVIDSLSSLGIAFLLFLVGLDMDLRDLRHVGAHAIIVGVGQVVITFGLGFALSHALGFGAIVSFYIAAALTLSSTIIVIKLLSEKKDLKSLYGRIVVGVLLIQDFVAMFILLALSGSAQSGPVWVGTLLSLVRGVVFGAILLAASRYLPKLLDWLGHSQELLYLFSIAWALGVAALAASPLVGLSIEVGGLVAGLTLANSSEHFQISSRLRPLRDFFVMLFFFGLGAKLIFNFGAIAAVPLILFILFVLVGNPLVVFIIMSVLGYRARTSFLASITMAQISEFSLILIAMGYRLGHLNAADVSLVTIVGVITIFISSYLITYGDKVYRFVKPFLKLFERRRTRAEEELPQEKFVGHVILVGAHRMGGTILLALEAAGEKVLVVDFDPTIVRQLKSQGKVALYGDIADQDIQEVAGFKGARVVISTSPDFRDNVAILEALRLCNPGAKVILTADNEREGRKLYEFGADYVLIPHFLGGVELAHFILKSHNFKGLAELKRHDLEVLRGPV